MASICLGSAESAEFQSILILMLMIMMIDEGWGRVVLGRLGSVD